MYMGSILTEDIEMNGEVYYISFVYPRNIYEMDE